MPDAQRILLRESRAGVLLPVRVQPRSRANRVESLRDGVLRIQVTAAPTDGQANAAVIEVVAGALHCARSTLSLARGQKSRDKTICISALSISEIQARLTAIVSSD